MFPAWTIGANVVAALRWLGVILVYVLPLVTLPLLPLGFLALAVKGDSRAYNLSWAARSALRYPEALILVWVLGVLFTLVVAGVTWLLMMILAGARIGAAVSAESRIWARFCIFAGAQVIVTLMVLVLNVMLARAVGLMGHHYKEIVEDLPSRNQPAAGLGYVGAGAMVSLLVMTAVVFPRLPAPRTCRCR